MDIQNKICKVREKIKPARVKRIFFPPNLSSLTESQALKLEEVIYYLRPNALDQRVVPPTLGWEELLLKLV